MLSSIGEPIAIRTCVGRSKNILNGRAILRKIFVASCGCRRARNHKSSHIDYPVSGKLRWCISMSVQTEQCGGNPIPSISSSMA